MNTTLNISFCFLYHWLTFVLLSFPSSCPGFICKLLCFLSVDEDVFGVLPLGTWDSKTSLYFRLLGGGNECTPLQGTSFNDLDDFFLSQVSVFHGSILVHNFLLSAFTRFHFYTIILSSLIPCLSISQ